MAKKKTETPKPVKKFKYHMGEGKAVTSRKGILGPGEEVKVEHFSDGQEMIDKLVGSGHIVKS